MFKFLGILFGIILVGALGYAMCYFGWISMFIDWAKGLIG